VSARTQNPTTLVRFSASLSMFAITRQSFDNARSRNVIGAVGVDSKDAVTFSSRINELAIVVIACLD